MIDQQNKRISVRRQWQLLSLHRSGYYYKKASKDEKEARQAISEIYAQYPIYGYRRITAILHNMGYKINRKKVLRLMRKLKLKAIYPKPNTSKRKQQDMVYPYLLNKLAISRCNQVWQVDITYIRTNHGFMYLVALIDVYSRYIVGARLSNSLCTQSCLQALEDAVIKHGQPEIINSDQGSQFTSKEWTEALQNAGIAISMTGKGRCCDNAYIERLWRTAKAEGFYLNDWRTAKELKQNLGTWLKWYNEARPHQSINYQVPQQVYGVANSFAQTEKIQEVNENKLKEVLL